MLKHPKALAMLNKSEHVLDFINFTIKPDRVCATVRVTNERWAYTTPEIAERLQEEVPHILNHACLNEVGPTFGAVAQNTSMPHVLEHVVIALQAQQESLHAYGTTYVGKTYWVDRDKRMACVEVNYVDDFVALESFTKAAALLDSIVLK